MYNGKEYENALDVYNFGARMYDPTTGRWFVPDPIDQFSDFSPYGFVLNDPMNLTDPDGMQVGVDGITKSVGVIKDAAGSGGFAWQVVGKRFVETPSAINNIGNAIGGFSKGVAKTFATGIASLGTFGMLPPGRYVRTDNSRKFDPLFENMPLENMGNRLSNGTLFEKSEAIGEIAATLYSYRSLRRVQSPKPIPGGLSVLEENSISITQRGKTIGLGINEDLYSHRGSDVITWKDAGWQKAGLTKVDWAKMFIGDEYSIKEAFRDASNNATKIRFDVTNFDPFYAKPKITNYEFNYILNNPSLLNKTTFIQNGSNVIWNGSKFVK